MRISDLCTRRDFPFGLVAELTLQRELFNIRRADYGRRLPTLPVIAATAQIIRSSLDGIRAARTVPRRFRKTSCLCRLPLG